MKRLFIVGSGSFIVHAMRFALEYAPDANLFGMVHGPDGVPEAIRRAAPDVVIVDGPDRLAGVREAAPDALIVLLAGPLEESALRVAIDAGAVVCMSPALRAPALERPGDPRPPRALVATIAREPAHAASNGHDGNGGILPAGQAPRPERCPLTARELEILRAIAGGNTNARVGRDLWVTEQTVKFHLSNIYRKLGVSNRTEASRYALMNGLADETPPARIAPDIAPGRWSRSSPSALASTGLKTA